MGYVMCFIMGVISTQMFMAFLANWEWSNRGRLEQRIKYLERNLCCGKGVFGCKAGPNCEWDHK